MPRVPIASEDERKFIVDGIQVNIFIDQVFRARERKLLANY